VIVPLRAPPLFAAIVYLTVPLPTPLTGAVMVIQGALVVAVHGQPAGVESVIADPVPPVAGNDSLDEEIA
jgi:hypothetical protein